jgi:dynein light chain 1
MAKPTPLKDALKALEAKEETPKEEMEVVKLYGFMPPIAKLDASLSTLKKCKKLSLSTNTIDKITSVSGMDRCVAAAASSPPPVLLPAPAPRGSRAAVAPPSVLTAGNAPRSLEILSLGRNNIKKIEGLDGVADTLKELWISYNNIEKLACVEKLKALEILYL